MTETLWTIAMVAEYLIISEAAADYASTRPDFPTPIILPSRGTGARQIKRWLPAEIKDWALSNKKAA